MADLYAYGTCDSHLWESQTLKSPPKPRYFLFLPSEVENFVESHHDKTAESFAESAELQIDSIDSTHLNDKIDCHNLTSSSLAMTVKDASTESIKIVSHAKTCGLSRNDEYKNNPCVARTASRSASWCIKRGTKEAGVLPLFLCKKREKARLSPKSEKRSFWCVGERGKCLKNMSAALFAKKCDYINENVSIESRRSERVENAESLKDSIDSAESSKSNLVDCHDSATQNLAMTPKDDSIEFTKMDSSKALNSHDDASFLVSHAKTCGLSRNDENSKPFCDSIDSHELQSDSHNDAVEATPHKMTKSRNDDSVAIPRTTLDSHNDENATFTAIVRMFMPLTKAHNAA